LGTEEDLEYRKSDFSMKFGLYENYSTANLRLDDNCFFILMFFIHLNNFKS
jgi:hypothetical protein